MVDNHAQLKSTKGDGIPPDELTSTPLLEYSPPEIIVSDLPHDKLLMPSTVSEVHQEKKNILTTITTRASEEQPQFKPSIPQQPTAKTLHNIYWLSPFGMISFLLLGIFAGISHHLYYNSFVGNVIGDNDEQQRTHEVGNFFAFIVQSSLVMSMTFAYTQWLWMTLKESEVTIGTLNDAFAAQHSLLFIFNLEMFRKIKVGYILAVTMWCLFVPSLFTPGTLFVQSTDQWTPIVENVRVLNISDPRAANHYTYSVSANGSHELNNESMMFLGPRTIIDRLAVATASVGEILHIPPPFVNSSYEVQFYGPSVQCTEASENVSAIIASHIEDQMQTTDNITQIYNAYFAYIPDLSNASVAGSVPDRSKQPSRGSNELWLSFRRNGTGFSDYPIPTCPVVEYRVCQLYNASYHLNLTFVDGNQTVRTVSGNPPENLNKIDYPVHDWTQPSDMAQHSYSAFMWVFMDQLIGTLGFYNNTSNNRTTPARYSQIQSTIGATSLLGSSDLECFFATHHIYKDADNQTIFSPDSTQRTQDILFAKNRTLDLLIPELAFNTTISLMADDLLAPLVKQPVSITKAVNQWAYHKRNLLLAYSVAIIAALFANLLGAYAYFRNKVSHDLSFSSLASTTTDQTFVDRFRSEDPKTRGKLPLPESLKRVEIKFTPLDEGGLGFQTADEVRRRRSVVPA